MKAPGKSFPVFILVLTLLAAGLIQGRYDAERDYQAMRRVFLSLPAGQTIRLLSFGFANLAADLLYIWSIQFYSTYTIANRFEYIERVFEVISDITPSYREPYVVGAMMMVYDAEDVEMALRLLEKGSRANPDAWIYDYEAGYYSFKFLRDYQRAAFYYDRAAARENVPPLIRRLAAHMIYMHDDLQAAWALWTEILETATDELEMNSARNHLYQIKAEKDLPRIQSALDTFREKHRRPPHSLAELVEKGFIEKLPQDFFGHDYIYDPDEGRIDPKRVFRWKRSSS